MGEFSMSSANEQLQEFLSKQEFGMPKDLVLDGKIQRFGEGKKGREPHWYVGSNDGDGLSLTIGSHKIPEYKATFRSKTSRTKSLWKKGSSILEKWQSCHSSETSAYLSRKKIQGLFGARINYFGDLVIPMYKDQLLVGLQTIDPEGKKLFVTGSKKNGSYFELEGAKDISKIYVAEGFATAASVMMATEARTICAFDSGNLPLVVEEVAKKYLDLKILIAGDDDRYAEINTGRKAAEKVSKIAPAIFPVFASEDEKSTDWNDLHAKEGLEMVRSQLAFKEPLEQQLAESAPETRLNKPKLKRKKTVSGSEIESAEPPRKEDFVLPGLLVGQVGLLCSPGGAGKSGVALILANQIASGGKKDLLGFGEIMNGSVVMFTLEDPLTIFSARQRSLKEDLSSEEYEAFKKNLHIVDATESQNQMSSEYVISNAREAIKGKPEGAALRLVIIDHLSYWSNSDLNDGAQCGELIKNFNHIAQELECAVLILHHTNRGSMMKGKDRQTGSVNIGGSYKLHSLVRWVAILEHIEQAELKKIYKLEGKNEDDYKLLSIDKVNHGEKLKFLLKRRQERMGLLYKIGFAEKQIEVKKEPSNVEVLSKEEADSFSMIEASPRLRDLDEKTQPIMRWLTRSPIFQTVSQKKRESLTELVNGSKWDKDRPEVSTYCKVWDKDDFIIVSGPVCDQEDLKLYAFMVTELLRSHQNGNLGLSIKLSILEILRAFGKSDSGQNAERVRRQINRLRRMVIDYRKTKKSLWTESLITSFVSLDAGRNNHVAVTFSPAMIFFYKAQEYTLLNTPQFWALSGIGASLLAFYSSFDINSLSNFRIISIEKVKELLSISPTRDPKEVVKEIKKAHQNLIDIGFFKKDQIKISRGEVHIS